MKRCAMARPDAEYRADVELLLQRLDNKLDDAQKLLAEMLPGRNRWQPWLIEHSPQALAERVAASLERIVGSTLDAALHTLSPQWWREAAALAGTAAGHREAAGHEEGPWRSWLGQHAAPAPHPSELTRWQAIAALVLTEKGEPRTDKGVNARQGIPASEKALKARWVEWKEEAAARDEALDALRTLLQLPPALIDTDERDALAALARVMLLAAAQLKLVVPRARAGRSRGGGRHRAPGIAWRAGYWRGRDAPHAARLPPAGG